MMDAVYTTLKLNCAKEFDAEGFMRLVGLMAYETASNGYFGAERNYHGYDYAEYGYLNGYMTDVTEPGSGRKEYELNPEVFDGHFIAAYEKLMAIFNPDVELYVDGDSSIGYEVYGGEVAEVYDELVGGSKKWQSI